MTGDREQTESMKYHKTHLHLLNTIPIVPRPRGHKKTDHDTNTERGGKNTESHISKVLLATAYSALSHRTIKI